MRNSAFIAISCLGLSLLVAYPTTASADEYGAIAYDTGTLRYGYSAHHASVSEAGTAAIHQCGTAGCKVVIEIGPNMCGALATAPNPTGWGAAAQNTRDAAVRAAMDECQKLNTTQCTVQEIDCNR